MVKKKRRPGRPVGEFGHRGSVMGLRLPTELRELLEQAAAESGRTISGELLWRLNLTFRGYERGESLGQVVTDVEKTARFMEDTMRGLAYQLKQLAMRKGRKE